MDSKHTPGPWVWADVGETFVLWGAHGTRLVVLDCSGKGKLRCRDSDFRMIAVDPAHPDMRLIAAAPELLAALKDLLVETDHYGGALPSSPAWDIARDAIAKAEGNRD